MLAILLAGVVAACGPQSGRAPIVLAAASLQPAMEEIAGVWEKEGHARPVMSFASSSALARQIDGGAPADLFISADEDWADYLERRRLIAPGSRVDLVGNRLVLVGSAGRGTAVTVEPGFDLAGALGSGRLAVADPDNVPAGKYAKEALTAMGAWPGVSDRLAPAENVRAALAMVERGQAPLGIVYVTDAASSDKVRILGFFPKRSHSPIRYPLVTVAGSHSAETQAYRAFLLSPRAQKIFRRHGFSAG